MAKRKLLIDDFDNLLSVTHTSTNAKVRGIVTVVSPMKKGKTCKYFDGELADDKARIRLLDSTTTSGKSYLNIIEIKTV